jgi:hypothetical protein
MTVGCAVTGLIFGASIVNGQEGADATFAEAMRDGSVDLAFRYRYELVEQGGFDSNANASTLRTRLTYASGDYRDFSLLLEMDDLRPVGSDRYNSTRNGRTDRPVVADPKATDLNQAGIRYSGFDDTEISFGRQRINHANQRFIGGVGWRQNEQTFDAVELEHAASDALQMRYTYVTNVNRIFGPNSGVPAGDLRSKSHFLDATYDLSSTTTVSGYAYLLDFDNAAAASNQTVGMRLVGAPVLSERVSMPYRVEYARQGDYGDNPTSYDANYYVLEAGLRWSGYALKLGYEVLEGNGLQDQAFVTPLATLHAFQGWADKFLSTPAGGIEDTYVSFTGRVGPVNLAAVYHDFSANSGGASYGDEIDLSAGWSLADNFSVLLKLASYSADGFATDTDKFWVMLSASF